MHKCLYKIYIDLSIGVASLHRCLMNIHDTVCAIMYIEKRGGITKSYSWRSHQISRSNRMFRNIRCQNARDIGAKSSQCDSIHWQLYTVYHVHRGSNQKKVHRHRAKKIVECKKIPIGLQHVNKCAHMKYSINAAFQW